ncbi:MAG TPA: transposase [Nevskiaceae bacterium]|nr:transposase [Nevskiaceae bacterium]
MDAVPLFRRARRRRRETTGKVARITQALRGFEVSSTEVSRCAALLDEELSAWCGRPLETYPYVTLDARYEKVRHAGQGFDVAASCCCRL